MTTHGKQIITGALMGIMGAFMWALFWVLLTSQRSELWSNIIGVPFCGMLMTSWFVLPLGGFLGLILPRLSGLNPFFSISIGVILGGGIGLLSAYLTAKFVWQIDIKNYVTMIPFCSLLIGVWTWSVIRKK